MRTIVKFHEHVEFLDEIRAVKDDIELDVVRVSRAYQDTNAPTIRHLLVIATFITKHGGLVKLIQRCGDVWPPGFDQTKKAEERADDIVAAIATVVGELGLKLRRGAFEG